MVPENELTRVENRTAKRHFYPDFICETGVQIGDLLSTEMVPENELTRVENRTAKRHFYPDFLDLTNFTVALNYVNQFTKIMM